MCRRDRVFRRSSLVALAGIALGAWGCKAGPGPPPLAPGADAAFERRLAQLDSRYRFLFVDASRVFMARMRGAEETVLLDVRKVESSSDASIAADLQLSPDGRWLLVPYSQPPYVPDNSNQRVLVLGVHSREVRRVPIPQDEQNALDVMPGGLGLFDWIARDRFAISLSHYPKGGGIRKKFFEYDLANLSSPRELTGFGDAEPVIYQVRGSAKFLWVRSDEPTTTSTIQVFDASGFRQATAEEARQFDTKNDPLPNGPRDVNVDPYYNAEPLFDFEDTRSHWDIRFGSRLVRRTWNPASTPQWDDDLRLYIWHESAYGHAGTSYVMDAAGRYQPWHRGEFIAKLPRELGR